jgi:hypothetical protein
VSFPPRTAFVLTDSHAKDPALQKGVVVSLISTNEELLKELQDRVRFDLHVICPELELMMKGFAIFRS